MTQSLTASCLRDPSSKRSLNGKASIGELLELHVPQYISVFQYLPFLRLKGAI